RLYRQERTTYEQNIALTPMLAKLAVEYTIVAKIDCSFVPMFCYHQPPRQVLESMATYGCEAGNVLLGVSSNGAVSGCSFLHSPGLSVFDLGSTRARAAHFEKIRTWPQRAPEPCRNCEYLDICKGGCRAVSQYVTGDFDSPDPDCPWVVEYRNKKSPHE
ncbi:MAG: SPASM domain-containing protein, partial [Planctomycetota bacterium]